MIDFNNNEWDSQEDYLIRENQSEEKVEIFGLSGLEEMQAINSL